MEERVLILTGNFGDGHRQAAEAIKQSLQRRHPRVRAEVVDYMKLSHPYADSVCRSMYVQGVKAFPSLYGFLFQRSRKENGFAAMLKLMNHTGRAKLLRLIRSEQPSVVVSTFPLAAGAVSALKESGLTNVPDVTVITDHTCHSLWVYPETDHYLVGSEYALRRLATYNVPLQQSTVTGIPVRAEFADAYPRLLAAKKNGLDAELPTLMIMGGGYGMLNDGATLLKALNDMPIRCQIVFICGHNRKLQLQLRREAAHSRHCVRVFGYVNKIHEFMAASDLVVTKPGGLTTSEALAMNLPMVLHKAIPGQEEDNANYLQQIGAAVTTSDIDDLVRQVHDLIRSPERLNEMRDRAAAAQRKHAADVSANIIMKACRPYIPAVRAIPLAKGVQFNR